MQRGGGRFAQEPGILTWEFCLAQTSAKNPDLLASREVYQKAIYQYRQSFSAFYPQASLVGSYKRGTSSATSLYSPDPLDQFNLGITLSQNLFNGLIDKSGIDRASALMKSADMDLALS